MPVTKFNVKFNRVMIGNVDVDKYLAFRLVKLANLSESSDVGDTQAASLCWGKRSKLRNGPFLWHRVHTTRVDFDCEVLIS